MALKTDIDGDDRSVRDLSDTDSFSAKFRARH
jgi:hypothetical protein